MSYLKGVVRRLKVEGVAAMGCESLAVIGFSGIIAEGLKSVLTGSRFRIKVQSRSLAEFWNKARSSEEHLSAVILDTNNHLPLQVSDLEDIRRWSATVKIVLMADESRFQEIMTVARHADSVILASGAGSALLKSLELVLLGQRVYPAELFQGARAHEPINDAGCGTVVPAPAHDDILHIGTANGFYHALRNLSAREVQVVNLLCDGSPNKIIARKLGISEATVKVHVKAILRKTHARNRTEAAILFRSANSTGGGAVLVDSTRAAAAEA